MFLSECVNGTTYNQSKVKFVKVGNGDLMEDLIKCWKGYKYLTIFTLQGFKRH
jgi:hypothetical protein